MLLHPFYYLLGHFSFPTTSKTEGDTAVKLDRYVSDKEGTLCPRLTLQVNEMQKFQVNLMT